MSTYLHLHNHKQGREFDDTARGTAMNGETMMIGQICGKITVNGQNCKVAHYSWGLVEFALIVAIATSQHPGGIDLVINQGIGQSEILTI